jgi:hypothetical protein
MDPRTCNHPRRVETRRRRYVDGHHHVEWVFYSCQDCGAPLRERETWDAEQPMRTY